jgi:phytoene dehydrogenase-like protein
MQFDNEDRGKYKEEKQKVAQQIIDILASHFKGIKNQIEVIYTATLMTWERYMGGSQGWFNLPNRKFGFSIREDPSDKNFKTTLPGLSNLTGETHLTHSLLAISFESHKIHSMAYHQSEE